MKSWGFRCTCGACADLSVFKKLVEIKLLDDESLQLGSSHQFKEAFMAGQNIIRLCDEVSAVPTQYYRTYTKMFQIAVLQK